jgi:hypothetical protein
MGKCTSRRQTQGEQGLSHRAQASLFTPGFQNAGASSTVLVGIVNCAGDDAPLKGLDTQ